MRFRIKSGKTQANYTGIDYEEKEKIEIHNTWD